MKNHLVTSLHSLMKLLYVSGHKLNFQKVEICTQKNFTIMIHTHSLISISFDSNIGDVGNRFIKFMASMGLF